MNKFKVIGLLTTLIGFGMTLVADWANTKDQETYIDELVSEKLKQLTQ